MVVESLLGRSSSSAVERMDRVTTALCVAAAALLLMIPTFVNGYPFIIGDSGTYLRSAVELRPVDDRPIFYSLAVRLLHWRISPWPIVVAQSVTAALIIHLVARTVFQIDRPWVTIAVCAVLCAVSSLPWYVGHISPDIFASLLMLAILLLAMGWERMMKHQRGFILVVIAASISFHYGNLTIALMAIPTLSLMFALGWRPRPSALGRLALVAGAIGLALAALISVNIAMRGRFVVSAASSTFMMAKLLEDGPALLVLQEECPGKYVLCSQLARLEAYKATGGIRSLGDYFLWYGPVHDLGSFKGVEPEAADVVREALKRYWKQEIFTAISNGARQLVDVEIGEGADPFPGYGPANAARPNLESYPIESIQYVFGSSSLATATRSLQAQGEMPFLLFDKIAVAAILLSVGFMAWVSIKAWRIDRFPAQVTVFTVMMVCGHAWLIGALSPLHGRYQSRVVWLFPLIALLLAIRTLGAAGVKQAREQHET